MQAKVQAGVPDVEIAEWMFTTGLRPNRSQTYIWNEHSRKLGWNDRLTAYFDSMRREPGMEHITAQTAFDMIEATEGRTPPVTK